MAFLFEHSCLTAKSELDMFSTPPTEASVIEGTTIEYLPKTNIADGPLIFHVSGDSTDYVDLNNSYLYYEVKVTKGDGTDLADNDNVGPINLLAQSLFRQVDIRLNDTLVSESSNMYHYRALLETILSYSGEAKNSQLSMSLYSKDTAGKMDAINNENIGLEKRKAFTNESKIVQLIGRIHSDIFLQGKYLINGVDINIKMLRNADSLILMAPADSTYKLKIVNASLFIRKIKVDPSIQLQHIKKMDKEILPVVYPIRRVATKSFSVATGSLSVHEEALFNGVLPKRIVIGLVKSQSYQGSWEDNPFNFRSYNLKYCSLFLDGKAIPNKAFMPDFTLNQSLREYHSLLECTGKAFRDDSLDIDRSEYNSGGYCLYGFDLSPDLCDSQGSFHLIRKGNLRLEIKFAEPLPHAVNVIVYSEQDGTIKIDRNRSVFTDHFA